MGQEQTEHLHLPLPDPGGTLEHDVLGLILAYVMIDMAIHELGQDVATMATQQALNTAMQSVTQALATKASVAQLQAVDQAQTNALQSLVVNTEQALQQLRQDIANKAVDLQSVLNASTPAQAVAGFNKMGALRQKSADSTTGGQVLEAGMEYALKTDVVFSRPLPAAPAQGDTIAFTDPWGLWKTGAFTLRRGHVDHAINGRREDLVFDKNCWRLTFRFVSGSWLMTQG